MTNRLVRALVAMALALVLIIAYKAFAIEPSSAAAFFAGGMAGGLVEIVWGRDDN